MSGLFYNIISFEKKNLYWRASIIIGMVLTSVIIWQSVLFNKIFGIMPLFDVVMEENDVNK